MIDGLGMGVGFAYALTLIGAIRELLGSLSVFGVSLVDADGMLIFILAPGAFITLAFIIAFNKWIALRRKNATAKLSQCPEEETIHA